jgi:hypothetical protein
VKDSDILELGHMLEGKGLSDEEIDNVLIHYGVRGMKWGVRRDRAAQIKSAQKELKGFKKNARGIVKEGRRASSPEARAVAAQRYKREVVDQMRTERFRQTYRDGNTATRGQMVASMLVSGPYAPLTYAAIRGRESRLDREFAAERGVAQEILREFRSIPSGSRGGSSRAGAPGFDRPATDREVARAVGTARREGLMD